MRVNAANEAAGAERVGELAAQPRDAPDDDGVHDHVSERKIQELRVAESAGVSER